MTETSTYEVGTRVSEIVSSRTHQDDLGDNRKGMVIAMLPDPISKTGEQKLVVKWDEQGAYRPSKVVELSSNEVMLELEAEETTSRLLDEWKKLKDAIDEKMSIAASAIDDAQTIANEHGKHLIDLCDTHYTLLRAMKRVGWSTSSLSC